MSLNDIKKELSKIEEKRNELIKKEKELKISQPEYRLADLLHQKICKQNHCDECSYFYETWEKPGYTKNIYINKASRLLRQFNITEIQIFLKVLGE